MMANDNDEYLLTQLKKGDFSAFKSLFDKQYPILCGYAFNLLRDTAAAEDIVQQLFIDLLHPKIYKTVTGNINGYLFTAVYHRCLRLIDNTKRADNHLSKLSKSKELTEFPNLDLEKPLKSELFHLKEIVMGLPRQRRQAVLLYYYQRKPQFEVANIMGVSISTVKTHLKLALATLRAKLIQQ